MGVRRPRDARPTRRCAAGSLTRVQPFDPAVLVKAAATFGLGLLVGTVGTVMHRSVPPWGLVLCVLLVLGTGLLARAWAGGFALAGLAGGMFLSVTTLARTGPGGDVLVPGQQGIGWLWVLGALVALIAAALAPRALFRDEPRGERPDREVVVVGAVGYGEGADRTAVDGDDAPDDDLAAAGARRDDLTSDDVASNDAAGDDVTSDDAADDDVAKDDVADDDVADDDVADDDVAKDGVVPFAGPDADVPDLDAGSGDGLDRIAGTAAEATEPRGQRSDAGSAP